MTLAAELAALIPLLNQFAPEIISLIDLLKTTPEQDHQKIMQRVSDAFNEKKHGGRPGGL
jgi:hypothetical protein